MQTLINSNSTIFDSTNNLNLINTLDQKPESNSNPAREYNERNYRIKTLAIFLSDVENMQEIYLDKLTNELKLNISNQLRLPIGGITVKLNPSKGEPNPSKKLECQISYYFIKIPDVFIEKDMTKLYDCVKNTYNNFGFLNKVEGVFPLIKDLSLEVEVLKDRPVVKNNSIYATNLNPLVNLTEDEIRTYEILIIKKVLEVVGFNLDTLQYTKTRFRGNSPILNDLKAWSEQNFAWISKYFYKTDTYENLEKYIVRYMSNILSRCNIKISKKGGNGKYYYIVDENSISLRTLMLLDIKPEKNLLKIPHSTNEVKDKEVQWMPQLGLDFQVPEDLENVIDNCDIEISNTRNTKDEVILALSNDITFIHSAYSHQDLPVYLL